MHVAQHYFLLDAWLSDVALLQLDTLRTAEIRQYLKLCCQMSEADVAKYTDQDLHRLGKERKSHIVETLVEMARDRMAGYLEAYLVALETWGPEKGKHVSCMAHVADPDVQSTITSLVNSSNSFGSDAFGRNVDMLLSQLQWVRRIDSSHKRYRFTMLSNFRALHDMVFDLIAGTDEFTKIADVAKLANCLVLITGPSVLSKHENATLSTSFEGSEIPSTLFRKFRLRDTSPIACLTSVDTINELEYNQLLNARDTAAIVVTPQVRLLARQVLLDRAISELNAHLAR